MEWTEEAIAKRTDAELKSLRENAVRLNNQQVASLCDAELQRRKPQKPIRPATEREDRAGQYVSEFHFVCPGELGVTRQSDGTLRTGIWVVATSVAEDARRFSGIVALHASRAESSYLQGEILGWEIKPRERKYSGEELNKTREGIEFIIRPTSASLPWHGDATGEKGYLWSPVPDR